jgi:hypothetical protein
MYLNGVIFQAHCVNFEIKKEQIATLLISLTNYFCIYLFFQKLCVVFEEIINK